ncbi:phosphate acyltransferase PlsX [Candidatus Phytoplasma sacchari]|uniref:Phosphate acyltransferase n=1 Tax=Candidatus Phytoplasma sacchari TaxID=2609813 RepID=A0ABY7M1N7_9MOLU|nr:phosphate acyltransferase PlsX [Candidatus Phytoplasma sacchari]
MIKLAIDAMGGDFSPEIVIKGVIKALKKEKSLNIFLYGDQKKIQNILDKENKNELSNIIKNRMFVIHTPYFLNMGITNIREELRDNPSNSLFLALKAAKNNEVDGVVSAGPTQALILSSYLILEKFDYMNRIALAPIFSSIEKNKKKIILDAGANIDLKPKNILDFAICASIIYQELFKTPKPIVKLLNIGKEKNKGRIFEQETFNLLKKEKTIFFHGNEEPNNILNSEADILLSDGFTTNMILKSYEGAIEVLINSFKKIMSENFFKKIICKILFQKKIKKLKKKIDHKEIGGAIILGLKTIVIKAHGNAEYYSFYKAIIQAKKLIENKILNKIDQTLKKKNNE